MKSSVAISPKNWLVILDKIQKTYPKSVWTIRSKMRDELGFTIREHKTWIIEERNTLKKVLYLDFFDDKKKTIFLLKYSEYL